jgi:site-specific recombinase XerC
MEAECWYYKFRVGDREFKAKGYTDKEATRQLASRLEREAMYENGAGISDPYKEHRKRPLTEHLADYSQYLGDKERNANYVQTTAQRIRDTIDGCRFVHMSDISPSKVQRFLAELRSFGASVTSSNHYLTAMKMFVNWLVNDRRSPDSPIAGMSKQNPDTDRRRVRRPLAWEEFDRLLRATAAGIEIKASRDQTE